MGEGGQRPARFLHLKHNHLCALVGEPLKLPSGANSQKEKTPEIKYRIISKGNFFFTTEYSVNQYNPGPVILGKDMLILEGGFAKLL